MFYPGYSTGGEFFPHVTEHYFLTDPDELIYTHFPYFDVEQVTKAIKDKNTKNILSKTS